MKIPVEGTALVVYKTRAEAKEAISKLDQTGDKTRPEPLTVAFVKPMMSSTRTAKFSFKGFRSNKSVHPEPVPEAQVQERYSPVEPMDSKSES